MAREQGWWRNVWASIVAAAVWDVVKPLLKPLLLAGLSLFGLASATIKRLFPSTTWVDAMISALFVTGSVMVPLLILLITLVPRRPKRVLHEIARRLLVGREIRGRPPAISASNEEVEAWLKEVEDWSTATVGLLTESSLPAVARFVDESGMAAASYGGVHPNAQRSLGGLNRRLTNLTSVMDNSQAYC